MKVNQTVLQISIAVILLVFLIWAYVKTLGQKISFSFDVVGFKLNTITLGDVVKGTAYIQTKVQITINNNSNLSIPIIIKDFKIYQNNNLLADQVKNNNNKCKYLIQKRFTSIVYQDTNVYINPENIQFGININKGITQSINFTVKFSIFGIPLTYKGTKLV